MSRRHHVLLLVLLVGLVACGAPVPDAAKSPREAAARVPSWVGMELRRGREPRELVRIGLRGALVGPTEGRLGWKLFADSRRATDSWFFLNTYAPFTRRSSAGELVFRGRGKEPAGPIQQRMIFEWARRVAAEAGGSRAGDSYGLILAWHQGGSSGICEDAMLYLTGEAVATSCGWEQEEVRGRLDPAQLGRVYGWFDRLRAFQTTSGQAEDPRPGTLETRLIFAGRGVRPVTAAEQAEIGSFSATLFAELAARRRGASPAAPAPEAPKGAVSDPPAQRLLLPPGALALRRGETPLQLPEKPPPVPRRSVPGSFGNPANLAPSPGEAGEGANEP